MKQKLALICLIGVQVTVTIPHIFWVLKSTSHFQGNFVSLAMAVAIEAGIVLLTMNKRTFSMIFSLVVSSAFMASYYFDQVPSAIPLGAMILFFPVLVKELATIAAIGTVAKKVVPQSKKKVGTSDDNRVMKLIQSGHSVRDIAAATGISKSKVGRIKKAA